MGETLQRLQVMRQRLDQIQQSLLSDDLPGAVDMLKSFDGEIKTTSALPNKKVASVFSARSTELRQQIVDGLVRCWDNHVKIETEAMSITIKVQEESEL